MSILELRSVSAHWNRTRSVSGYSRASSVSIDVPSGCWLLIAGPNGVGKSTLLHAIGGAVPYMSGTISANGTKLKTASDRFWAGVQFVPQQASLSGSLSFQDAYDTFRFSRPGLNNDGSISSLRAHLESLEVIDQGGGLSGRNFDLCLSLLTCPQVLLLDEIIPPQSKEGTSLYKSIKDLLPSTTVVFVDHDLETAIKVADRILWLRPDRAPMHFAISEAKMMDELLADMTGANPSHRLRSGQDAYDYGEDQNVIRLDRSPREQISLAVQAHNKSSRRRAALEKRILGDFPFLNSDEPAEILSGGERTILAWFLIEFSRVGRMREPFLHLDGSRAEQLQEWMKS